MLQIVKILRYLNIVLTGVNLHQLPSTTASHLEVDLRSSSSHTQAEGWHINSTITFPKDEEVILSEIWEPGIEALQGSVVIISNLREEHVKGKCSSCSP